MTKRAVGQFLLRLGAAAVAGYFALLALLYFQQDSLLFYPRPELPSTEWAPYRIEFSRDEITLRGWFIPSPGANATVVYYGGNGEELSRAINRIRRIGDFNFLLVNYRGYGASDGQPGEAAMKDDARFILDTMVREGMIEIGSTHVVGRSLGTGIAAWLAARYDFASVVLLTPYDSIASIAADLYPFFPVRALIRNPFNAVEDAGDIDEPVLIIKAERDSIVPHVHTARFADALPAPPEFFTVPGTTHNRLFEEPFYRRLDVFLQQHSP